MNDKIGNIKLQKNLFLSELLMKSNNFCNKKKLMKLINFYNFDVLLHYRVCRVRNQSCPLPFPVAKNAPIVVNDRITESTEPNHDSVRFDSVDFAEPTEPTDSCRF